MAAYKFQFFVFLLPIILAVSNKDPNKHRKDRYYLHKNCAAALHKQINEEMRASLIYTAMASHFDHNSIARAGFTKFFSDNSKEEVEHAHKFINYLNLRGSLFSGFNVKMPTKYTWNSGLEALRDALNLEKHINNNLLSLHDIAGLQCSDQHLMDYLENEFLDGQVKSINALHQHISVLRDMDDGMGEYLFDRQLQGEKTEL